MQMRTTQLKHLICLRNIRTCYQCCCNDNLLLSPTNRCTTEPIMARKSCKGHSKTPALCRHRPPGASKQGFKGYASNACQRLQDGFRVEANGCCLIPSVQWVQDPTPLKHAPAGLHLCCNFLLRHHVSVLQMKVRDKAVTTQNTVRATGGLTALRLIPCECCRWMRRKGKSLHRST